MMLTETEERTGFLGYFEDGGRLYLFAEQCHATTRKGERCRLTTFEGQVWSWDYEDPDRLYFAERDVERAVAGLCRVHRKASR